MFSKKTLYILRHAKAETGASYQDDHQRGLTERGVEAATLMGKYMLRHSITPERVLCSTAERACATWQHVQAVFKEKLPVEYSERLYLSSANETLNLIASTPEEVGSLLVVGHNPGFHQLALALSATGEEALLDRLVLKYPTCAFTAINLGETAWSNIAKTKGELTLFVTPASLSSGGDDD